MYSLTVLRQFAKILWQLGNVLMRLRLALSLCLLPIMASATLQNPDSDDETDCQQIAGLIQQCLNNRNSPDPNCQTLRTQQGMSAARDFIQECQNNFGGGMPPNSPPQQQGFGGGLPSGTAQCSVPGVGFIANNTIDQCARIGQAYQGRSLWGGHQLSMQNGNLMVDGRPAGRVQNPSGTYGSLSQRCHNGDLQACQLWQQQSEQNSQQYQQMYPPGWNRR